MRESDLRLHLRAQTELPIGLIPIPSLASMQAATQALEAELSAGKQVILFDSTDPQTQATVGDLLWSEAQRQPLFSASSSGLTAALVAAWRLPIPPAAAAIEPAGPLLVLSGSCSPATERQIRWALAHGFDGLHIHPETILSPTTLSSAIASLSAGRDTIVYTALGPPQSPAQGESLGANLGILLGQILDRIPVRRVLLCGGDTSSHAVQQLGLTALTWRASLQPGAPLCQAHADRPHPPLELVLKGGQVGTEDCFAIVRGF